MGLFTAPIVKGVIIMSTNRENAAKSLFESCAEGLLEVRSGLIKAQKDLKDLEEHRISDWAHKLFEKNKGEA